MARRLQPSEKDIPTIVVTLNEVVDGRSNNAGSITLRAGFTTTTKTFLNTSKGAADSSGSTIVLSPRTANAAAALATTYISDKQNGSFTLTHLNAGTTDRTFDFACVG